jgi:integrase
VKLARRRRKDTDDQVITRDQLTLLLPVTPDRYRALIALACGTGLRWGEAVDFSAASDAQDLVLNEVHVIRVADEVCGNVWLKPYPKSKAGRRAVPLPPFVVELLQLHLRAYPPGDNGLIFVARSGEPLRRGTFRARVWGPR